MSAEIVTHNEIDDYIATFTPEERDELAAAEAAIDFAFLLHQAREEAGLTQAAAAERAGLQQQAVSRLERAGGNVQLATIQRYLDALGYSVDLTVKEKKTGRILGNTTLPPITRSTARSAPLRRSGARRLTAG